MSDVVVEPAVRAERVIAALSAAIDGSGVVTRGSLAVGAADRFSDVDLEWRVPGPIGADDIVAALAGVDPVESVRWDPDSAAFPDRRLVFVRFTGWSLFQRVDLEVVARFDEPAPASWSASESALMNAVAAVKALRRGRGDVDGLLARGLERVGAADPGGEPWARVDALVDAADAADGAQASAALARRIRAELLG